MSVDSNNQGAVTASSVALIALLFWERLTGMSAVDHWI